MIYQWLKNKFFSHCRVCDRPLSGSDFLCANCLRAMPRTAFACEVCGLALPDASLLLCGMCIRNPPNHDRTIAAYAFATPVDKWIRRFKFSAQLKQAPMLAHALWQILQQEKILPQLIMPIPLHTARIRERGFNQAYLLAKYLGKSLSIAVDGDSLRRDKKTLSQAQLKLKARAGNLRGAFSLTRSIAAAHVALVDDVMTSGATVNEAACVLKAAGVERVDVWVVARAQNRLY